MTVDLPRRWGDQGNHLALGNGEAHAVHHGFFFSRHTVLSIPVHAWSHLLSCQEEVEEVKAAAHGDEHAHRHGVGIHMLDDELPAHQHDHAEQGRAQHQLVWRKVLSSCRDRLAMMSPKKEMGPTMAVATAMQRVTPSSRRRNAAVVVHAEVDSPAPCPMSVHPAGPVPCAERR